MKRVVNLTMAIILAASSAVQAKPSLWSYPRVDQGLFDMGVAYGIKENCDSLDERTLYGLSFALSLRSFARNQGYTNDEVMDFWKSKKERKALRVRVTKYLNDQGLDPDTPNALCAFGKQQMADETQVGKFLRNK
ncbi:MAG: DUF5333 domain-containing protein [Pseudomonadota bacterium]